MKRGLLLSLALALGLCCALPSLYSLDIGLEAGFGGLSAAGRWAPLRISFSEAAAGSRLEVARLDAAGKVGSIESLALPEVGMVEYPFPVDSSSATLRVRVLEGEELLLERGLRPLAKAFPGHLVLCLGIPASFQRAIAAALEPLEPVESIAIKARDLPLLPLDFDAVAGLVLADSEAVFSPAQFASLRAWLAAGGRLVILDPRGAEGGLARALGLEGEGSFARLGLGAAETLASSVALREGADTAGFWKTRLGLEPFGRDSRVAAGRLPAGGASVDRVASPLFAVDALLALAGSLWILLLVLVSRAKRGFLAAGLLSLVFVAAALPAARLIDAGRRGLASVSPRALIFADGSVLAETRLSPLRPEWNLDLSDLVPPRALRFSPAAGGAGLLPTGEGSARLRHAESFGEGSLLSSAAGSAGVLVFAPGSGALVDGASASWSRFVKEEVAYAPAGGRGTADWYLASPLGWVAAEGPPPFLGAETAWAAGLRNAYPGLDFVFGRGQTGLPLAKVEGGAGGPALWARPFEPAARPSADNSP